MAGVLYAAPVAIKIIADGIRNVSPTTVEAARSAGSSTWQVITKVQLPMSARTLVLATNQGIIYVLSMVVISGLSGSGALGFDVVQGFTQISLFGKGLAAGLAIVLLGVMLDRITRGAADRTRRHPHDRPSLNQGTSSVAHPSPVDGQPEGQHSMGRWNARKVTGRAAGAVAVVVAGALALTACGGAKVGASSSSGGSSGSKTKACGTVNLADNAWVGYEADLALVSYVMTTKLHCTVKVSHINEQVSWQGFGSGQIDAILENWGHEDLVAKYITQQNVAEDAGQTGLKGIIGWYVPPWMAQKYPDITNWQNLNKYASMFKTSESGGQGPAARRRPVVRHQRRRRWSRTCT